jgi:tetratricopeptide (TPR) repeat protein
VRLASRVFARGIWQGVPAILVVSAVLGLAIWVGKTRSGDLARVYRQAAHEAMNNDDLAAAALYLEKLVSLDATDLASKFGLASVAHERGKGDLSTRLINELAPPDRAIYAPAHLWLARQLIADGLQSESTDSPAGLRLAARHLEHALRRQPGNLEAHELLGRIHTELYQRTGDRQHLETAAEHIGEIVEAIPEAHLGLAHLHAELQRPALAQRHARHARDYFRAASAKHPGEIKWLLGFAEAEVILQNFPAAVTALRQAMSQHPRPEVRAALVNTYLAWLDRLDPDNVIGTLQILQQASRYDPYHDGLLARLLAVVRQAETQATPVEDVLENALVQGQVVEIAHLLLGSVELATGDQARALLHLEQAQQTAPHTAVLLSNLGRRMANAEPADLDNGLRLCEAAVELAPDRPELREGRGHLLAELGRYEEAVTDLNLALAAPRDQQAVHRALANAYARLGQLELAEEHQAMVEANSSEIDEPGDRG